MDFGFSRFLSRFLEGDFWSKGLLCVNFERPLGCQNCSDNDNTKCTRFLGWEGVLVPRVSLQMTLDSIYFPTNPINLKK